MITHSNAQQKSGFVNIIINIILPSFILMKASKLSFLGPIGGLILALSFPFIYGVYSFIKDSKANWMSVFGLISLLLTGGIGLFHLDGIWLAIKEASIPFIIGCIVLGSIKSKKPLIRWIIDMVVDVNKVYDHLANNGNLIAFEKRLKFATFLFSLTFFLSAAMNYGLAKWIVVSPSGTVAFNEELGQLTALSFPVIALPSTIILFLLMWFVFSSIQKYTQLDYKVILDSNRN